MLLKPLEHIKAELECRFISRLFAAALGAKGDENACKLKRVVKDVELEQLVQHGILLTLEHKLDQHSLLCWLQRDLILED